jgi:hypothetical protein
MEAAFQHLRELVRNANLSTEMQQQILWVFDQLPQHYADFARTYDVRYRDAIIGHVQGVMNRLAKQAGPDAAAVLQGLVSQLQSMHERLAIPSLNLKLPAPPKAPSRRKAA